MNPSLMMSPHLAQEVGSGMISFPLLGFVARHYASQGRQSLVYQSVHDVGAGLAF